jgi:hypothetical protein
MPDSRKSKIQITGSHGEIHGITTDSRFTVRHIDHKPGHGYSETEIDLNIEGGLPGRLPLPRIQPVLKASWNSG